MDQSIWHIIGKKGHASVAGSLLWPGVPASGSIPSQEVHAYNST